VRTPVERGHVLRRQDPSDEPSSLHIVEQEALEAEGSTRQWHPTLKTLLNISGNTERVVPKLDEHVRNASGFREWDSWSRCSDELPHTARPQSVIFGYGEWVIHAPSFAVHVLKLNQGTTALALSEVAGMLAF
jgi:hypothetical protein